MKRLLAAVLLCAGAQAFDLSELIESAQNNEQVQAYADRNRAAQLSYKSARSSYLPSVDIGGNASYIDKKGSIDPGDTYKVYAEANFIILDGFRRENLLDEKTMNEKASRFDLEGFKKALSLQVIQLYFNLEKVNQDIIVLQKNREQLNEQLERFKLFYDAGIATEVDVERLNAAVANADYEIASRQYEVDSLKSKLELLSGTELKGDAVKRRIAPPISETKKPLDRLTAMQYRTKALGFMAEQADSVYYPTISLNDTYAYYDYQDFHPSFPIDLVDHQNRFTVMLSMNLVDFSAASQQRQSIKMEQHALGQELLFEQKSAESDRKLALKAIERSKTLLEAAKKSKEASDKTFKVVKKKYEARIVDYISYLDALSKAAESRSQYHQAASALNSAYAAYIYNLGEDPKEYVQ